MDPGKKREWAVCTLPLTWAMGECPQPDPEPLSWRPEATQVPLTHCASPGQHLQVCEVIQSLIRREYIQ